MRKQHDNEIRENRIARMGFPHGQFGFELMAYPVGKSSELRSGDLARVARDAYATRKAQRQT